MMADDKVQTPKIKIQTRREGKTLFLECHDNDLFQGTAEEHPYMILDIVEQMIKQNEFKEISRNKNQIRIRVGTAILELNSQEALQRKKLQEKIQALTQKNIQYENQLSTLRSRLESFEQQRLNGYENTLSTLRERVQTLEQRQNGHIAKWQEEDLNSTANFDVGCIYKLTFSNGYSYISSLVNTTTLYFVHNHSASYTTSNSNRRAHSTGWTVVKMMKLKQL